MEVMTELAQVHMGGFRQVCCTRKEVPSGLHIALQNRKCCSSEDHIDCDEILINRRLPDCQQKNSRSLQVPLSETEEAVELEGHAPAFSSRLSGL
jgi:hypothetical protein